MSRDPNEWFWRDREWEELEWYKERRKWYEKYYPTPPFSEEEKGKEEKKKEEIREEKKKEEIIEEKKKEERKEEKSMEKEFPEPPKREKKLVEYLKKEMPEYVPEKPPEQPPEKPPKKEQPPSKPMRRSELIRYVANTGIDVHLIWKQLNEMLDKVDPEKNPSITREEQISYLENEVIPWATYEEAIEKEKRAEETIEEFKRESAGRRASIVKRYGDVIDIVTEEVLKRIMYVLGTQQLPVQQVRPPETYYKTYEQIYENLDSIRKNVMKDIFKELMR